MKLYKEHVVLAGALVGALIILGYMWLTNGFDSSATVDGFTPVEIQVIKNTD